MHATNRSNLKTVLILTCLCLSLIFMPGFWCYTGNMDYVHLLSVTPSTLIISQGSSSKFVIDFSSNEIKSTSNSRYGIAGVPDGMNIAPLGPEPPESRVFRTEYSIETSGVPAGIYKIKVTVIDISIEQKKSELLDPVVDSATLTVLITPWGGGGISAATDITGGFYHSLAITEDGSVWSWGLNDHGQLGDGTTSDRLAPVKVQGLPGRAVAIAAGGAHSMAILEDGTVWSWGDNSEGQTWTEYRLDPNDLKDIYLLPRLSPFPGDWIEDTWVPRPVVAIAAGEKHSIMLDERGNVLTCGRNVRGQLGHGGFYNTDTGYASIPTRITSIAAGKDFSLALDENGQVWGWGDNRSGQLGDDLENNYWRPVEMLGFTGVQAIAAGLNFTIALKGGRVLAAGDNSSGQLGVDNPGSFAIVPGIPDIDFIDAGFAHCLALGSDGLVYGWGANSFGQLSVLQPLPDSTDTSIGFISTVSDVSAIAAGGRHTLCLASGCLTAVAWGDNVAGQLGDGTGQSSVMPVKIYGLGEDGSRPGCNVSLSVIIVGKGKVTSEPEGIDCGNTCAGLFEPGTTVSLIAEPEPGWSFKKWDGDAAGTERTTLVTVDTSKICIAYFASDPIPPVARFSFGPDYPYTTDRVVFDASESYDNGWIARYEWDFDNDGTFDLFGERTSVDAVFNAEFVKQFWAPGTYTVRLRVTDNDGMTDETTGEIHVREPEPPRHDLGDAPDSSNTLSGVQMIAYPQTGVIARYPTVYRTGSPPYGPIHLRPRASFYLGKNVSLENEADVGIDEDGTNNISPAMDSADRDDDDGVSLPGSLPYCGRASMDCTLTVVSPPNEYIYVNVWFDWNRDGDWDDVLECPDGTKVPEWGVRNEEEYIYDAGTENLWFSFKCWHPSEQAASDPIWIRVTVSEQLWSSSASRPGGSGPPGGYELGETEDYYFQP